MNSPEMAAELAQELLDGVLTTDQLDRKIKKIVAEGDVAATTANQPDEAAATSAAPDSTTKLLVNAERAKRRIAAV